MSTRAGHLSRLSGLCRIRGIAWLRGLVPTVIIEAGITWLDAGQPDPDQAAGRIGHVVHGAIQVARPR